MTDNECPPPSRVTAHLNLLIPPDGAPQVLSPLYWLIGVNTRRNAHTHTFRLITSRTKNRDLSLVGLVFASASSSNDH